MIYDDNHISIEGDTNLAYSEDVLKRFESYGWHTLRVTDANDLEALDKAMAEVEAETNRPSIIAVRSHIGYGSPLQDNAKVHGSAMPPDMIMKTKEFFKWPQEPTFYIPEEAKKRCMESVEKGKKAEAEWNQRGNLRQGRTGKVQTIHPGLGEGSAPGLGKETSGLPRR